MTTPVGSSCLEEHEILQKKCHVNLAKQQDKLLPISALIYTQSRLTIKKTAPSITAFIFTSRSIGTACMQPENYCKTLYLLKSHIFQSWPLRMVPFCSTMFKSSFTNLVSRLILLRNDSATQFGTQVIATVSQAQ